MFDFFCFWAEDDCEWTSARSATGLEQIKGKASWWNQLQWEDKATKDAFRSKFIDTSDYV